MNEGLHRKLAALRELITLQKKFYQECSNETPGDYMQGMANGMILAHAVFDNSEPDYVSPKSEKTRTHNVRHKSTRSRKRRS